MSERRVPTSQHQDISKNSQGDGKERQVSKRTKTKKYKETRKSRTQRKECKLKQESKERKEEKQRTTKRRQKRKKRSDGDTGLSFSIELINRSSASLCFFQQKASYRDAGRFVLTFHQLHRKCFDLIIGQFKESLSRLSALESDSSQVCCLPVITP